MRPDRMRLRTGLQSTCSRAHATGRANQLYHRSHTFRRGYSLQLLRHTSPEPEVVRVPCRSNGDIRLTIYPPLAADDPSSPTILYLPTGPIDAHTRYQSRDLDSAIIPALVASSNAVVVKVEYRLGNGLHYPGPIHDVVAAYDWVKERLADKDGLITRRGRYSRGMTRLGVCGQFVGGSLALMLALTESKLGETRPAAVAVHNPVVDWVFPEDGPPPSSGAEVDDEVGELIEDADGSASTSRAAFDAVVVKAKPKRKRKAKAKKPTSWQEFRDEEALPASSLLATRDLVFRKPDHYFDPFASPLLFFRSPGADVPAKATVEPPADPSTTSGQTRRRVHRKFPPSGSGLLVPHTRLSLSPDTVLLDQGLEMARLMRRAVARDWMAQHMQDLGFEVGDEVGSKAGEAEGERRVSVVPGGRNTGFWGLDGEGWRDEVERAGSWLRTALEEEKREKARL